MKTLKQAIDELPPTMERVLNILFEYPNKHDGNRLTHCPLAQHLSAQTGFPVVVCSAHARPEHSFYGEDTVYLPSHIGHAVNYLDEYPN